VPTETATLERDLARSYTATYPGEAAHVLETASPAVIARHLEQDSAANAIALLERLGPGPAADALGKLADEKVRRLLSAMHPRPAASLLARLDTEARHAKLSLLDERVAKELLAIMSYPPDTAGHLMDPRFVVFRETDMVRDLLRQLPTIRKTRALELVVVDPDDRLAGLVPLQAAMLAEPDTTLRALARSPVPAVHAMAPRDEVIELLEGGQLLSLPVVDLDHRVLGVIRYDALMQAVKEDATADLQTMVGVSEDERVLSSPFSSVRKRLPWLNINLLTAFLAAAVVGAFESTIARFTALAVLLPVVAGQSGNTGMQALAVTMRGLALREVRVKQWVRIITKEVAVGAVNGVAIALVTAVGVYIWSQSLGLCFVIAVAMVLSMVIAGLAGAAIPVLLAALGQDPAQSSSIILTTVTDVMGFLSFLGLATLCSSLL